MTDIEICNMYVCVNIYSYMYTTQDNEAGPKYTHIFQKISRLESIFYDSNPILRSFPRFSTLTDGSVFRYRVMGSFSNKHTRIFMNVLIRTFCYIKIALCVRLEFKQKNRNFKRTLRELKRTLFHRG